jgi:glucose/mannose-6-phosphate isomerase
MAENGHVDLDDPETYGNVDPDGVYSFIRDFPSEVKAACELCAGFEPPENWARVDKIIVLGMGGSGIAGRVLGAYVDSAGGPAVVTCRGYNVPKWVDRRTLALCVSYSGNTAETLNAAGEALSKSAHLFAVTSGGKVGALAQNRSFPAVKIPAGRLPRHSLGYLAVPLFECLGRAGIIIAPSMDDVVGVMVKRRDEWGADSPTARNDAKLIAREIYDGGYFPVVYGAGDIAAVAAERTRCQLNEDAKMYASNRFFPELCHNEVVGYEGDDERLGEFYVLVYRGPRENEILTKQTDAALDIIGRKVAGVRQIKPTSEDTLPALFELIYFGDFLGYYTALLRGINPEPVKTITELKERMK